MAVAGRVKTRTLILQGDKDFQVPSDQAGVLARAVTDGGNNNVELAILPDVNHVGRLHGEPANFEDRHLARYVDAQVIGAIANWLSSDIEVQPGGVGTPSSST